jgi:putative zinc finger protein
MNKCIDTEIQEMLPDLLHRTLADGERQRVEAHVAGCESCQEELEVLRTVKSAAVFAPTIDVDRVVRQIPPYRSVVPGVEAPAWHRPVQWLVAAAAALVVIVGGSVLIARQPSSAPRLAVTDTLPQPIVGGPDTAPSARAVAVDSQVPVRAAPVAQPRALALATDVESLSDGSLVQLMNEMDRFDALPAAEPEPVISVDSGDSI